MRRLFSTFARGWPGSGLLLIRVVACAALLDCGITHLEALSSTGIALLYGSMVLSGILLLLGLWTPVTGVVVGLLGIWYFFARLEDPWISVLLSALGFMLAMVGPGAYSIDARLYGWKRIDVLTRKG